MKVHACQHRGCRELIPQHQRFCSKHQSDTNRYTDRVTKQVQQATNHEYNQFQRDPVANQFYHSHGWQAIRQQVLLRDMYTDQVAGLPILSGERLIVDHIKPQRLCDTMEDKLDPDNLWVLSTSTHNIKTKMEQSMTDNQLRHCSREWWAKVLQRKLQDK